MIDRWMPDGNIYELWGCVAGSDVLYFGLVVPTPALSSEFDLIMMDVAYSEGVYNAAENLDWIAGLTVLRSKKEYDERRSVFRYSAKPAIYVRRDGMSEDHVIVIAILANLTFPVNQLGISAMGLDGDLRSKAPDVRPDIVIVSDGGAQHD